MLDRMQTRAGGEHPPGKDALDLALERHLVDFEKGVGVRRLGRRARVAHARGDLQRPELHRFADPRVEGDDAAGDLVESGEDRPSICDLLRRHFGDDRVVRPRCRVCRLGRRRICRLRRNARALKRRRRLAGAAGGAVVAPAGGGKGCLWTPEGERAAGNAGPDCPGNRTGGGCAGNAPLGISAGGRSVASPNVDWAATGPAASVPPSVAKRAAIRSMEPYARASFGA
jgi:hypothetical protein